MSNLSRKTKAELIAYIDELEARTVEARLEQIRDEFLWFVDDLKKAARWVYDLGADARYLIDSFSNNAH